MFKQIVTLEKYTHVSSPVDFTILSTQCIFVYKQMSRNQRSINRCGEVQNEETDRFQQYRKNN